MILYSQRDPRWSHLTIPPSSLTLGRYGCTITCIAMLTTYFLPGRSPADLLSLLRFTPGGLVIWDSCKFENFRWYRRAYSREDDAIRLHIKDPKLAVILQVAHGSHWVVPGGIQPVSGNYNIADPWLGDRASISRYGNNITGAAYFSGKVPTR